MVKKVIMYISIAIATLFCGYVLGFHIIKEVSFWNVFLSLVLIVVGTFVFGHLHIVFHELGHLVGGKLGGFDFISFSVGSICLEKKQGKLKLSYRKQKEYGGVCQMVPSRIKDVEKCLKRFVLGGLIASLIYTLIFFGLTILPIFVEVNQWGYTLISTVFPISLFLLYSNAVFESGAKSEITDGGYLKLIAKKTPQGKLLLRIILIQEQFSKGVRPRNVEEEYYSNLPYVDASDSLYYVTYSTLLPILIDKNEKQSIISYTNEAYSNIEKCLELYRPSILADIMFVKLFYENKKDMGRIIFEIVKDDLEREGGVSSLRMKIAYEVFVKEDHDTAKKLYEVGKELKGKEHFKGNELLEWDLIEKMIFKN